MSTVAESLQEIKERIHIAAKRADRNPGEIEIMAVTKTRGRDRVLEASEAGMMLFGENRVQEAVEKFEPKIPGSRLHLVGHLQRNKAKAAAAHFDEIESIDKIETIDALLRHLPDGRDGLEILLEVNTSGEASKSGVESTDALRRLLEDIRKRDGIRVRGLMTIAPFTDDERRIRAAFETLRNLLPVVTEEFEYKDAKTLSMGMSSDFELAIEEGATRIRLGTILFGTVSISQTAEMPISDSGDSGGGY